MEQTAEVPEDCITEELNERVVGKLEGLERLDRDRWQAVISYAREALGTGVPQLLTLLFGNVSMKSQVRVTEVRWPTWLLDELPGPAFGIPGLRALQPGSHGRPLLCTALKPMGLSTAELADRCYRFARGGVELIKDDHGLHDQTSAPFAERIARCQDAIERARGETGSESLYLPNIGGPMELLAERVEQVRGLGIQAVFVSPFVLGLDTLRWLASESGLVVLAHPALSGVFFHPDHGISPQVVLGDLLRILGADGVIYPNAGGRFPFSENLCQAINQRLRRRLGPLRPAFPVAGGGVTVDNAPSWTASYGADTVFLIGGSLYQQGDLEGAAVAVREALAGAVAP